VTSTQSLSKKSTSGRLWVAGTVVGLVGAASAVLSLLVALLDAASSSASSENFDLCGMPLRGFWKFWEGAGPFVELSVAIGFGATMVALAWSLIRGRRVVAVLSLVAILVMSPIPWITQADRASGARCNQL
jgi:hypothetical protein